ncbi:hypothetical protein [uncultured Lacinutrix sp.]|uniref:hypothetical protein n=1 Tax=uncultured Lacinutrix sp. TaxID=574032 RepID=UPI00261BFB0F|nr:hypothetical protein [uncultured Lacinutrix sp.]
MKIEILPNEGFKFNSDIFYWNDDRKLVREKLKNQHKEDDKLIEMPQFFNGDTSYDIDQKRDVYQDTSGTKNCFLLSYDKDNQLIELEVHSGIKVWIDNIALEFEKDIKIYLNQLNSKGYDFKEVEQGNYLFEKLKITIADSESIGGDGNGLSYLYSGQSIEHLIDN